MENFTFLSSTRIIFGRGTELKVGEETAKYGKKVLMVYGGGSIKKTGLYDKIVKSLKDAGLEYIELSGVQPNPRLSLVKEGISVCRENNCDFVLAVGGGSVIDTAKAIGVGVYYDGDVWDFWAGKCEPQKTLPVGVVLTIAAAGSEASKSSVITNEDGSQKVGLNLNILRPVFAIMNPELMSTLPPYQIACGVSDIMAHVMERYFTNVKNVELTDRLCEAVLKTVVHNGPIALKKPDNYDALAEIMWASTLAHNDLLETGRVGDFASHRIEHELSAYNDVAHGAGLAVIFPAWMKYVHKHDIDRFCKFAVRVFDVEYNFDNPEETALEGISRLENFFVNMGLPVRLSQIGITNDKFEYLAKKCRKSPDGTVGNFVKLRENDILEILKLAE